jgi:hypothetical protein
LERQQDTTVEEKRQPRLLRLLFDNQISIWKYILRTGLISLIPSLIFVMILGLTGIINDQSGPKFEGSVIELFVLMVIVGPPIETLLMAGGLWILSFITKRQIRLAVFSALVWAVVHSLVAPAWGLGIIWPFFVFSCSYLAWRKRSWWHAILVTSCVHAFQNFLPAIMTISTQ